MNRSRYEDSSIALHINNNDVNEGRGLHQLASESHNTLVLCNRTNPGVTDRSHQDSTDGGTYIYRNYSHVLPEDIDGYHSKVTTTKLVNAATKLTADSKGSPEDIRQQRLPAKLYAMLSDPEVSHIITWMPHGRAWKILRPKDFEREVAPKYFEYPNYNSFLRLVNAWSFRRITTGIDSNCYFHELFLRGMPHLQKRMRRMNNNEKKAYLDPSEEPDFYAMEKMAPHPGALVPNSKGNDHLNRTRLIIANKDSPMGKRKPKRLTLSHDHSERANFVSSGENLPYYEAKGDKLMKQNLMLFSRSQHISTSPFVTQLQLKQQQAEILAKIRYSSAKVAFLKKHQELVCQQLNERSRISMLMGTVPNSNHLTGSKASFLPHTSHTYYDDINFINPNTDIYDQHNCYLNSMPFPSAQHHIHNALSGYDPVHNNLQKIQLTRRLLQLEEMETAASLCKLPVASDYK